MKHFKMLLLIGLCLVSIKVISATVEVPDEVDTYCKQHGCTIVPTAQLQALINKAAECEKRTF